MLAYSICYSISINVKNWIIVYIFFSEVCLKTALDFTKKCTFRVKTAQTYFKFGTFDFRIVFISEEGYCVTDHIYFIHLKIFNKMRVSMHWSFVVVFFTRQGYCINPEKENKHIYIYLSWYLVEIRKILRISL